MSLTTVMGCAGTVEVTPQEDNGPDPSDDGKRDAGSRAGSGSIDDDDEVIVDNNPEPQCGDGVLDKDERCDDSNAEGGDGCSSDCKVVEDAFLCPIVGAACERATICGDGRQTGKETCDDGNDNGGDGCSAACLLEADFACFTPGDPCVSTVDCGDGKVTGEETCDDGNVLPDDGCSADCQTQTGWLCQSAGLSCQPECGDGLIVGRETCDDGNDLGGDGCSENCRLEPKSVCDVPGEACRDTDCGDGVVEGDEPCDDGADIHVGDGCSPGCVLEPICAAPRVLTTTGGADAGAGVSASGALYEGGACSSTCGDGLILAGDDEECDDGNSVSGDGCDAQCRQEEGFFCDLVTGAAPDELTLHVVYRDFVHKPATGGTVAQHPDFETYSGQGTPGLVEPLLGSEGKPVYTGICEDGLPPDAQLCPYQEQTTSEADFDEWYRDTADVNLPVSGDLVLTRQADDTYVFDSGAGLFPLDDLGWQGTDPVQEGQSNAHNFGFTTELRYWFEFQGGEFLEFSGDDDVWVFIGGRLVVDLGGLHSRLVGSVTLDDATATPLGLEVGRIYEIALFHAERHTGASNFKLTIGGFLPAQTSCESICGDGFVAGDERCDDGDDNGKGYGFCTEECTPGERCGDGITNGDEECDNEVNLNGYLSETDADACAPGCVLPPRCGDGALNSVFGEQCDDGEDNDGSYDGCNTDCTLGPRCGDGEKNGDEECDDGNPSNEDSCDIACKNIEIGTPT